MAIVRPGRRGAAARFRAAAAALVVAAILAAPAARAIEVQRVTSAGGIEAWLVEDHTNSIIAVRFAFRGGAALDPAGREGLAEMAVSLLDEGAGELGSEPFQRRLEDLAARLHFDAESDTVGGELATLTRNRDAAFELLRLALTRPRFDDEPVARVRSQMLARIKDEDDDPGAIAQRTLARRLYPDHPYGRPVQGTAASVAAIGVEDLRRYVAGRLARDNLVVGVVGDITPAELAPALDSIFGALPARAQSWTVIEATPAVGGAGTVVRQPVPQSVIVFAQRGVKRDDPDFYAAYVMNHILGGGGFTSRLYDQVREKRGLAYSVYTTLDTRAAGALIRGGAGTANARAAETVRLVREEWRRMAAEGVTAAELADAKTFLTGSFPLRFSSSGRIAGVLVDMQLDRLGIDYLDRRNALIEAVTLDQVNWLARDLLEPARLTVVVVGEPDGLDDGH